MWIKDIKGDIINTDKYHKAEIYGQGSEVKVKIISTPTTNNSRVLVVDYLFEGTKEECKEYMDKLVRDLNGPSLKPKFYPEPHADYEALYDASKLSEGDTFRLYPNGPLQRCVKADRKGKNMPYILFEEAK